MAQSLRLLASASASATAPVPSPATDHRPVPPPWTVLDAIKAEEERLTARLAELKAAKELANTHKSTQGPPGASRSTSGTSVAADYLDDHGIAANGLDATTAPHYGETYEDGYGDAYSGGGDGYSGGDDGYSGGGDGAYSHAPYGAADRYAEPSAHQYVHPYAEPYAGRDAGRDEAYGGGAYTTGDGYAHAGGDAYTDAAAYPHKANDVGSYMHPPAYNYPPPAYPDDGSHAPPGSHGLTSGAHVAAALEAAAAVACAVPWSEPPPFQAPRPFVDPAGCEPHTEESDAQAEAAFDDQTAVEAAAIAHAGEETAAAAEDYEAAGGGGYDELLRVPATLRLNIVGEGNEQYAFSAADLPSPPSSPRHATHEPPSPNRATLPPMAASSHDYEVEAPDEYDNYSDDVFEDDDDESDDAARAEDEAAREEMAAAQAEMYGRDDGALVATLPSGQATRQNAFGSFAAGHPPNSMAELESTLRQLQMANDEQAVVQDEVETLSGTLRAVAAMVAPPAPPPAVSTRTIDIHRQFSGPDLDAGSDFQHTLERVPRRF